MMSLKRSALGRLIALLAALALAVAAEFALVSADRARDMSAYMKKELSADRFIGYEFLPTGEGEYYALANNSYWMIHDVGGMPVQTVEVYMDRADDDTTETVIYFSGIKDEVAGEFVAALVRTADGVYTAELDVEQLDSLRIHPTEQVRSTVRFTGVTVNPSVETARFSVGRALLLLSVVGALFVCAFGLYQRRKGNRVNGWLIAYPVVGTPVLVVAYGATQMFTAIGGHADLLLPVIAVAYTLLYLLLWLLLCRIDRLETKLAVIVMVAGMLFAVASAPLQAPDEFSHFLRMWSISEGRFAFDYNETFPDDVRLLCQLFPGEFYNVIQSTGAANAADRIVTYWSQLGSAGAAPEVHTSIQVILPYLPGAAVTALARLFGADALVCLYLARIANVAVYAACAYFALRRAKRYRGALLLFTLLPLTLFMVASVSYDSMLLGAALLFLGAVFGGELSGRSIVVTALSFAVVVSIKPVYLPLALAVFAIPADKPADKKRRFALFGLVVAAGVALYAVTMLYSSLFARNMVPTERLPGVDVNGQIHYVLNNPLRYLMVMLVDGYMQGFYLDKFGVFGWLDVMCVLTNCLTPVLIAVVAGMYTDDAKLQKRGDAMLFSGITLLSYAVLVTGFYATWSTLGSTSVLGVQTRYFLPVVPLLAAVLSRVLGGLMRGTRNEQKRDMICLYLCSAFAVLSAAELAIQYFLT